jgi:uncharacterized membrane protein SpoIIM required for sporulation
MRETQFIEQNKEKWAEFEAMLKEKKKDPDKLNDLFVQITDDLSYARTFYPNRSVRMYLNGLAQKIFHNIYLGKRFPKERIKYFWTDEIPQVMWDARKALLLSFCIFLLAFGIGVLSSIINPDFARVILGDSYVEMTLENINDGDPMRVYKESRPMGMTVGIAANNLFVALRTALFGVLASIGTLFIMLYNGIMIGAFQFFFIEQGLFWESFLTIWIHGTLEVSSIIIAGAAGLVAGSGLLFPGTYTRTRAFQLSMRKGLKIFIGIVPTIVLAAIFEGFFTRYTGVPDPIRGLFILLSLAFVLWYFVWLPWYKAKRGFEHGRSRAELPPDRTQPIVFDSIKNSGEIFSDAFTLIQSYPRLFWSSIIGLPILCAAIVFGTSGKAPADTVGFGYGSLGFLDGVQGLFESEIHWYYLPMQTLFLIFLLVFAFRALESKMPQSKKEQLPKQRYWLSLLSLLLPSGAFCLVFTLPVDGWVWMLGMVLFPLIALWAAVIYFETPNPFVAFRRTFRLARLGELLVLGFLLVNLGLLLFLFMDSSIWNIILSFFSWLVPSEAGNVQQFNVLINTVVTLALLYFTFLLLSLSGAFLYFSGLEITDASGLRLRLRELGESRQIRGLNRE